MIRGWMWAVLCLAAAAWGFSGCAVAPVVPVAETVGTLAPSYRSIAVAPVHHDAPPELGQIVDSGDDGGAEVATTVTRAADPDAAVTPDVAPKTDGIQTGEVR